MEKEYFNVEIDNLHEIINYDVLYNCTIEMIDICFLKEKFYSLYQVAEMFGCNAKSLKERRNFTKINLLVFSLYKDSKDRRYFFRKEQVDYQFILYKKSISVSDAYNQFVGEFDALMSKNTFLDRFITYKIEVVAKNVVFLEKDKLKEFFNYVKENQKSLEIPINFEKFNLETKKSLVEIVQNYYTAKEVREKLKIGKSVLSRSYLGEYLNREKVLICGNKYFFEKKYIDKQYEVLNRCVTFEKVFNELKKEGLEDQRRNLDKKIENKVKIPLKNETVFIYKDEYRELKKIYKIIGEVKSKNEDYNYFIRDINLKNKGCFDINAASKYTEGKIDVRKLEQKYYSMNYVSTIFKINRKLIPDRCKKNKEIDYIKLYDCRYFFEKKYIDKQKEIFLESITTTDAFTLFNKKFEGKLTVGAFIKKFDIYNIDLFGEVNFIELSAILKFMLEVEEVINDECIGTKDLKTQINECVLGFEYASSFREKINVLIKKLDIKCYERQENGNVYGKRMFPKVEVERILAYVIEDTFSIVESGHKDEMQISDLKMYMNKKKFYYYGEAADLLKAAGGNIYSKISIERNLKNKRIRAFKMKNQINEVFLLKSDLDDVLKKMNNSLKVKEIVDKVEVDLGRKLDVHVTGAYLKNKGISTYRLPFTTGELFLAKKDEKTLYDVLKYEEEFRICKTEYEKLKLKVKYKPKKNNIPKTLKLFYKYCLLKSNKTKSTHINTTFYEIYTIFCEKFDKDVHYMKSSEIEKLFIKLINLEGRTTKIRYELIQIFEYLKIELELEILISFSQQNSNGEYEPFDKEAFFVLFLKISEILLDKKLYKLMIRNRKASSAVLYVYLHYFLAWRKMDLVKKFPIPNLEYIGGWKSGEEFLKWIEAGNDFTEEMGNVTCAYMEEYVERINLRIQKTDEKLILIFPKVVAKNLGLLICICEANRQIAYNQRHKNNKAKTLIQESINNETLNEVFKTIYDVDLCELLSDKFSNTRANKSFMSNISDKAEEFQLAIGYYYAQKFRNHKMSEQLLSEVTKIYLRKDTSIASVLAFLSGTMGAVKYLLLDVIDKDFSKKSRIEKFETIIDIPMSNLEIEKALRVISKKSNFIKNELDIIMKNKKDIFLRELLYGNFYGKHDEVKCLFKIIKRTNDQTFQIGVFENNDCKFKKATCIGCEYMLATKYFIYEFSEKFNSILDKIDKAQTMYEKEVQLEVLKKLYIPTVLEVQKEFGKEKINQIFNVSLFNKIRKFDE